MLNFKAMKLPENVVPMSAEQRAHIATTAQAAIAHIGDEVRWNRYFHAVRPETALATLAYVEALEAEVQRLTDSTVSNEVYTTRTDAYVASIDELRARLSTLEAANAELRGLRGAVTSLLEDLANGCVPVKMEAGKDTTPYFRGVNAERQHTLAWAGLKCKELGIEWPIKAIPYAGNLPSEPVPAAALPTTGEGKRDEQGEDEKRPYHIPSAAHARKIARQIGYGAVPTATGEGKEGQNGN